MAALFGNGQSTLAAAPNTPNAPSAPNGPSASAASSPTPAPAASDMNGLISAAAKDLAEQLAPDGRGQAGGECVTEVEALKVKPHYPSASDADGDADGVGRGVFRPGHSRFGRSKQSESRLATRSEIRTVALVRRKPRTF